MSKLFDIKGYWDSTYEQDFNEINMWEGKIILEDDGWFEGVVNDTNSPYKQDRLIFGVHHPDKVIELYKCSPSEVSDPFVFHGKNEGNGYDGQFEVIGLFGSHPYGVSRIFTKSSELSSDKVDEEITSLIARMDRFKNQVMDDAGKNFYENYTAIRKSLCKIILRNYEGIPFTPEEEAEIMAELGPVSDRVEKQTVEAGVQYVKKVMPDLIIEDDEDDLPF